MDKCPLCDTQTQEGFTKVKRIVNGKLIRIVNVPCLKCQNEDCNQVLIHSPAVRVMRMLVNNLQRDNTILKGNYNYHEIIRVHYEEIINGRLN